MGLTDFALERYFARYEFTAPYLLCSSDPESMSIRELLALSSGSEEGLKEVWLGYTEYPGHPALRQAIAATYERASPEEILVHSGAEEPIYIFMQVALEPGDHLIFQFPAYQSHYEIARGRGVEVSRWEGDPERDWAVDPDDLGRLVRPNTRALVICSPHNPTGHHIDRERLDAVVSFARRHGLWLFSDEVYRGLERDPAVKTPPVAELYERGVSLGVMSKVYGLAGLRIGWVLTRDRGLKNRMAAFKDYVTICNSAPSEYLATVALRHHEQLVERTRMRIQANLEVLDGFFARHSERFRWRRPSAGTTAFPMLRRESAEAFCRELVERAGILLLPSLLLEAGDRHFRVGYGRRNLPEVVERLEAYLRGA